MPLKKSATQSSTPNNLGAHLAIDENVNTCSFAGTSAHNWSWWRVELDGVFDITEVVLNFIPNTPCRFSYKRHKNKLLEINCSTQSNKLTKKVIYNKFYFT